MNNILETEIRSLDKLKKDESKILEYKLLNSSHLFNIGLTMYGEESGSLFSSIYAEHNRSLADSRIILHQDQIEIINNLNEKNIFLSAPTSFGKTYTILEYIAINKPKKVIIVAPTLALLDQYKKDLYELNNNISNEYSIYHDIDFDDEEIINEFSIFLLTHDRAAKYKSWKRFSERVEIDFSVIDEIHKLDKNNFITKINELDKNKEEDEIKLSRSFWNIISSSKRYILIGPNIKSVNIKGEDLEVMIKDFKPVINDYESKIISDPDKRDDEIVNFINADSSKKLVYFPGPEPMKKFIYSNKSRLEFNETEINKDITDMVAWISENIHERWYVVQLLKKGVLLHNGTLPKKLREKIVSLYENQKEITTILTTSTLIDGVNTSAENLLITRSRIKTSKMSDFELGNLIGRTGRTNKHFVGKTMHIRWDEKDPKYDVEKKKMNLEISILEDELRTDLAPIIDVFDEDHKNFIDSFEEPISKEMFNEFFGFIKLEKLIAAKSVIKECFNSLEEITNLKLNKLIMVCHKILPFNYDNSNTFLLSLMFNNYNLKKNIDFMLKINKDPQKDVDEKIDKMIKYYYGGIENDIYPKIMAVYKMMQFEKVDKSIQNIFFRRLIHPIESKFFLDDYQVFRTMHKLGFSKNTIEICKTRGIFDNNKNLRIEKEIEKILIRNGIRID